MNMESAFQTFIEESQEMLLEMESQLLHLESSSDLHESINSIFRAAHTIKGSSGLFGLNAIVEFTHDVESVLDRVRSDEISMDEELVNVILQCKDHIGLLIDTIEEGELIVPPDLLQVGNSITEQLVRYLPEIFATNSENTKSPNASLPDSMSTESIKRVEKDNETKITNENWHISVQFGDDVLRNGMDPLAILKFLSTRGNIEYIETIFDGMPDAEQMDSESCYLRFEINFSSSDNKSEIESVFEFVRDDCNLYIVPPLGRVSEFISIINSLPSEQMKIGELLVRCGSLTEYELETLLKKQGAINQDSAKHKPLGELIVDANISDPKVVQAALKKQEHVKKTKQIQTVRVDAEKLDELINLIGELVIAGASIDSEICATGLGHLHEAALPMLRLVEEVRDCTLNLRMVQIGDTFNRFHRVVRDVSKELGKDIKLTITGADTELDKTVIEKITDPLTHLVRNAIDHGIESSDVRVQKGKAEQGELRLHAYHESGSIVIEVADDGGGLNCDKLLSKAIERGLVNPGVDLTNQDIYKLIFEPGFSTASEVSNISGRGVGMDVVRRNIESLRGNIEISSETDKGTTIRVRLPLTLAIIDGFLVGVGDNSYVIPLEMVVECIELREEHRKSIDKQGYISLRGEVLPYARLRSLFGVEGVAPKRESIVVIQYGSKRAGFAVDTLQGECQTVIKPLNKLFENLTGIGGSTILGNGNVALILDMPSLVQRIEEQEMRAVKSRKSTIILSQ